eukprot:1327925-Amphidinium_carterae.1
MAQWIRHRPTELGIEGSSSIGVIYKHCLKRAVMSSNNFPRQTFWIQRTGKAGNLATCSDHGSVRGESLKANYSH